VADRWVPTIGALFCFLNIGSEAGVTGWIATYAQRMVAGAGTAWFLTPSLFLDGVAIGGDRTRVVAACARVELAEFGLVLTWWVLFVPF